MAYPRIESCSRCTTRVVIDCVELQAFVACPSCGAKPCAICNKWFIDEVELLVHTHKEEKGAEAIRSEEDESSLNNDEEAWTFWERRPQLDREIEIEWEKHDSRGSAFTVYEACCILGREGRGFKVEYQAETDESCWIHGLRLNELTALERLDALDDDDEHEKSAAIQIPWARNVTTGEVSPDIMRNGEPRKWRYCIEHRQTEDNGVLAFKDRSGAERCSSALISGSKSTRITTEHPEKKRRIWRTENVAEATAAADVAALKHGGPSVDRFDLLFQLLESLELPPIERRNILRKDTKIPPRGVNVGLTNIHFKKDRRVSLSQTVQLPELHLLTQALTAFFHCEAPLSDREDFCFTSIQLNRGDSGDDGAALHVDRNNLGPSFICGLGPYQGGQLWSRDHGIVETRRVWTRFNGKRYHATLPYKGGPRYTLVYWCHANYDQVAARQQHHLERLGFCFPTSSQQQGALLLQNNDALLPPDSKEEAREAFRLACRNMDGVPSDWAENG